MKPTYTAVAASIAIAFAAASTIAFGQSSLAPAGNDWPQIAGNLGAQGYTGADANQQVEHQEPRAWRG